MLFGFIFIVTIVICLCIKFKQVVDKARKTKSNTGKIDSESKEWLIVYGILFLAVFLPFVIWKPMLLLIPIGVCFIWILYAFAKESNAENKQIKIKAEAKKREQEAQAEKEARAKARAEAETKAKEEAEKAIAEAEKRVREAKARAEALEKELAEAKAQTEEAKAQEKANAQAEASSRTKEKKEAEAKIRAIEKQADAKIQEAEESIREARAREKQAEIRLRAAKVMENQAMIKVRASDALKEYARNIAKSAEENRINITEESNYEYIPQSYDSFQLYKINDYLITPSDEAFPYALEIIGEQIDLTFESNEDDEDVLIAKHKDICLGVADAQCLSDCIAESERDGTTIAAYISDCSEESNYIVCKVAFYHLDKRKASKSIVVNTQSKTKVPKKKGKPVMDRVTYFDVEYANSHNKSICQIGLVCENFYDGEPVFPEREIYINPEDNFAFACTQIHGIDANTVHGKPTFPEAWKDIEKYFVNSVIVGHNVASSDLNALVKNLKRYNLDIPELYYICTYDLAMKCIDRHCVDNYQLSTLCEYFDIDIDSEHNAFDDACACSDLFKKMVELYDIDPNKCIKKYNIKETKDFAAYIGSAELRKNLSEFYGVVRGFSIDGIVSEDEIDFLRQWRAANDKYSAQKDMKSIIDSIDEILADGKVTLGELANLQYSIKAYLDIVSTAPVTLATQILDGILKGITVDGEITESECINLRQWLYDNIYLSNHFPFDKAIATVEKVLEDGIVTKEESEYFSSIIHDMLDPISAIKSDLYSIEGKSFCLTGDFDFGSKSEVEAFIVERGGSIAKGVTKKLNVLLVGSKGSNYYAHGTYGTKFEKAQEYIDKGIDIQIVKEKDFFDVVKA